MKDQQRLMRSLQLPVFFVVMLWLVKGMEYLMNVDLSILGNYPRKLFGLTGIVSSPLVHGDLPHLMSNSVPIVILGALILYFYPSAAKKVIFGIYLFTGIAVWVLARPVYHIGASGLVYGFAFFLFFSGVFRNDVKSLAISFFIIFMYGGIIWGLLPHLIGVSWESHLFGAVTGSLLAYHYRMSDLPPADALLKFDEPENEISYRYVYVPKKDKEAIELKPDDESGVEKKLDDAEDAEMVKE